MVSFKVIFLFMLSYGIASTFLAEIPDNWQDYIAPEMIKLYEGKGYQGSFSAKNFQGDIKDVEKGLPDSGLQTHLDNVVNSQEKRWPNGTVPYTISELYDNPDREMEKYRIQLAMNMIESSSGSCVKFIPRTDEQDYVTIIRGLSCESSVGRQGGRQIMSLMRGCLENIGSIQHELMHALGFYHEIARSDRDDYIWINWGNVLEQFKNDFKIPTDATSFGLPYDYESVLHYPYNAFAIDDHRPTIVPKTARARIGQNIGLSLLDILRLKLAYDCPVEISWNDPRIQSKPIKSHVTSLSDFQMISLEEDDCNSLKSRFCPFSSSSDECKSGRFATNCNSEASVNDVRTHLEKVHTRLPLSPIWFEIYGPRNLTANMFAPMARNIIIFGLLQFSNFKTDQLATLELTNLLELRFFMCSRIRILKSGMREFTQLRSLIMIDSTVYSMEKDVFESLMNLKMLVFEWWINKDLTVEKKSHLRRFHCSTSYAWFREYLAEHSDLTQPRSVGELFNVSGMVSVNWVTEQFFIPVDCLQNDLRQQASPFTFSINVDE